MKSLAKYLVAALAALAASGPATAQTGPVSYWRFDEAAGAVATDSAGADHGAIASGATRVPGVVGSALQFDGVDDFVTFQRTFLFNQAGDATLLLWARRDDDNHRTIVWGRDGGGEPDVNRFHIFSGWLGGLSCNDGEYGYGYDYRDLREDVGDANVHRLPCAAGITPGQWSHLALTREGNLYSFYVNGTLVRQQADASPLLPTYTGSWTLGLRHGGMSFLGAMDELALYARALTPDEIRVRYRRTLRGQGYEGSPPAGATCTHWSLAGDFRTPPTQANPSPDACGNPVWSYLLSPSTARDPAAYVLFPDFQQDWGAATAPGIYGWNSQTLGDYCIDGPCAPLMGFNASGQTLMQPPWAPFPWYGATAVVHPGVWRPAVVAFRSPFTGVLEIDEVRFTHLDPYGGDGVDWTVDLGATSIASGIAYHWGSPGLVQGPVAVKAGDLLYATVGPNGPGNLYYDTTQLDIALHMRSIEVAVDVWPGVTPNLVLRSRLVPVAAAVLGSPVLDAASVDPATLVLAGAPVAKGPKGAPLATLRDVNGDGIPDLVALFPSSSMTLPLGNGAASLAGALRNGTAIFGQDAVRVLR